ncbi:TraR/DksA family transcriptional regulator [Sulfuriflexus sp.]|uniref:TraR/DksA family transcriptional regulator n=1 Tax=Sulfuriflexus sp. TaxID=2015443 RepID=UPI0028CC1CA1|nr:TraR/DksA family transcriptional regulator [Sulfuriflexus sp.]MDT8404300.1 TraR/DksA family transcriptional regulator [Sulfuriflexus sp.]
MDIEDFRSILLARRAALQEDASLGAETSATVELDQSRMGRLSRMDAMQGQAMSQEAQRRREMELRQIAGALQRIETGDYGYCIDCDQQIAEARLEIDPAALRCILCAGKVG